MKKIYALLPLLLLSVIGYSQYYYSLHNSPGKNPGNLNQEDEYPFSSTAPGGWTKVLDPNASPVWSAAVNIPFSFEFNGTAFTQFKVSNTGVMTFDIGASSVPGFTNAAIPNAAIPDNSIMVWGIQGTQSNDFVVSKTFGSAPNRQYWIFFSSYTKGATATWTYFSIVLEETTDKFYIVDQRHSGAHTGLTIGTQVNSTSAIGVKNGASTVATIAGSDPTPIDNGYYEFFPGTQPQYDLSVISTTLPDYLDINAAPFPINATAINQGSETVTSVTLNYSVNNGPAVSSNPSAVNISSYNTGNITSSSGWTPSAIGSHTIKIWASNINGNNDQYNLNDTLVKSVYVATGLVQRRVLFEQFTSSTCAPCASSDPTVSSFLTNNGANADGGKIVAVKYHQNFPAPGTDLAYSAEALARRNYYGVNSIPRAIVGGNEYDGNPVNLQQSLVDNIYGKPAIFKIDISKAQFTDTTVTIKGEVTTYANIPAGYRLHVLIIEKEIDKDVHTSYSNVTTTQKIFKYVMRKMLPNANGTSLPSLSADGIHPFEFEHKFKSGDIFSSMSDLTVVAFIQNNSNKEIFQAQTKDIEELITTFVPDENATLTNVKIFPNPFTNQTNVSLELKESTQVTVSLTDALGREVLTERKGMLDSGTHEMQLNIPQSSAGIYLLKITAGDESLIRKVSIR